MRALPASFLRPLLLVAGCAVLFLPVCAAEKPQAQEPQAETDPVPLRRVLVVPERVSAELEKVRTGVLRSLPYTDLQAMLKAAARAGEAQKKRPRLVEASYSASLSLQGEALQGSGEWTVFSAGRMGILEMPDLNLALQKVQFKQEAADAILGDLDGKALGLLVKDAGKHSVVFDWSARGTLDSDGMHFKLKVPPCPVGSLELTLAKSQYVRLQPRNSGVLTRIHQDRATSRWQIRLSGRSEIDLIIHETTGNRPLVLTRLQSNQELTPNRLRAEFKFQVEVLHNLVRKLYFACDPEIRPYDVRINGADLKWHFFPAVKPGKPHVLVIELRDAVLDPMRPLAPLSVRCFGRLTADRPWTCPGLRLVKALPWGEAGSDKADNEDSLGNRDLVPTLSQGEDLVLQVHAEVQLENWQPANFRLVKTELQNDRTHVLTLASSGGSASWGPEARPSARLKMQEPECLARQLTWWQVNPGGATLETQITYELARGRLFQVRLALPRGWEVDQVKPGDSNQLLRNWAPLEENQRGLLIVDLERPLLPQMPLPLTVRLRSSPARPVSANSLDFPDIEPLDARIRAGGLAITVHPQYRVAISRPSVPAALPEALGKGQTPWGRRIPDFYFPYRLRMADAASAVLRPAVTGKLLLQPHPARFRARCQTELVLAADRASAEVRLHLEPEVGHPRHFDLYVSAPAPVPRLWKVEKGANQVESLVPLLPQMFALSPGSPLGAAHVLAVPSGGQWWRLTLTEPLRTPLTLKTALSGRGPAAKPLAVPLLAVPAADILEGEVAIYLAGINQVEATSRGLREAPANVVNETRDRPRESAMLWRIYRYGHGLMGDRDRLAQLFLSLSRRPSKAEPLAAEIIDQSRLTTYVEPSGRLLNHFAFQVWNWRRRILDVRLPREADLLAVNAYGRWIRLPHRMDTDDGPVVELQVAAGLTRHRFELVYTTPRTGATWMLWSRIEAPAPALPVRPLAFRRLWRLPAELVPLTRGGQRRLPGPDSAAALPRAEFLLQAFRNREGRPAARLRQHRQLLAEAAAGLHRERPPGTAWRLGEVLHRLAFEQLKGQVALVLDAQAVRDAGLGSSSVLPADPGHPSEARPLGKNWDLVYVLCPGAALLTTATQRNTWGTVPLPAAVEEAVLEATAYGQDASGRFRSVADWLRDQDPAQPSPIRLPAYLLPDQVSGESYAGWTTWEPAAGAQSDAILWVVRYEVVPFIGLGLGVLLALAAWRIRRLLRPRMRFRLLMAWLAGCGLAWVWLPSALRDLAWWPALTAFAFAMVWYVWSTAAAPTRTATDGHAGKGQAGALGPATAAALALVTVAGLPGQAAAPTPATVFLLQGPAEAPDRLTALVRPELLVRLRELARRGTADLQGAVLLSAEYRQKEMRGTTVDFDADFQVYCFQKEATLILPLENVVLKPRGSPALGSAFFAGKPAYPVALRRPRKGYALPVQVEQRGIYTLELSFTAQVSEVGDDRSLGFAVPRLPQSRLTLDLPRRAQDVLDETGLGTQEVIFRDGRPRLTTSLGRVGDLRIRWRVPKKQQRSAAQVTEMYLWDLRRPAAALSGILKYEVKSGTVSRLGLALAAGIEVRSVEVRRFPLPDSESAPRLLDKGWRVNDEGGKRRLLVELHRPVSGRIQMILELLPRLAAGSGALGLALPMPLDVEIAPGSLAYRVEGAAAAPTAQHLSVTWLEQETFLQNWRKEVPKTRDPGPPTLAYTFKRTQGGPPGLRLALQLPDIQARQDVRWRVGGRHADLEKASVTLTASGKRLMLVEWEVPDVTVAEVSGPQVHYWTRTGSRVQVWLKGPCAQATIDLSGWIELPAAGSGTKPDRKQFNLPRLHLVNVQTQETIVRLAAASGLALELRSAQHLTPVTGRSSGDRSGVGDLVFTTQQPSYGAVFTVRPAEAAVRVLTRAEVRDRHLVFTANLDYEVTRGQLRKLRIYLRNWPGDQASVNGAYLSRLTEQQLGRSERMWTLYLAAGAGRRCSVQLSVRVPLEAAAMFNMPDIRDASTGMDSGSVTTMGRWLAVLGPDLTAGGDRGLVRVAMLDRELGRWFGKVGGAGKADAWRIRTDRWQLRLRPQPAATAAPVRMFLAEQAATVADGRRWIHEATYGLYAEAGANLRVDLPDSAAVLAVYVDGGNPTFRQPEPGQLWITLAGGPSHIVRVSWIYPGGTEPIERPQLVRPRLRTPEGAVADVPPVWTVDIPPGFRVDAGVLRKEAGRSVGAAGQDLARASAQLRLITFLADQIRAGAGAPLPAQLLAAQERFFWYCRQAEYRLALAGGPAAEGERGPHHQLEQLRGENRRLLSRPGLEKIQAKVKAHAQEWARRPTPAPGSMPAAQPDRSVETFQMALPRQGLPTYWQANTRADAPDEPLRLTLSRAQRRQTRQAVAMSGLLLICLVAAWCLPFVPLLPTILHLTWPEQIVLLGWLVWQMLGFPWTGLGVMGLGIAGRLYLLVRWGLALLHRATTPALITPGSGTSAAS
jgi:hypothetical protein